MFKKIITLAVTFSTTIIFSADKLACMEQAKSLEALELGDGSVISAQYVTSKSLNEHKDIPPRTIVKLRLSPAKGSNINVEIWLPEKERWNGKFLGLGNGGAAGGINPAGLIWPIRGGFAVATTDMGTAPNSDSGIGNPEVWKDFGFRATHLMTVNAKKVIGAYYGKLPDLSYFVGGSTGGQQALQEAQRYPEDYDGIVANVPAHCRTPLHAYFLWNDQILRKCPFTSEQEANVIRAGIEYMAGREVPQTAGRCVSDPRCTREDIEGVIALALKKDSSLTPQHADALRKLFEGPRYAGTGEVIFNGIPFGSTFGPARGNLYLFQWVFGKDKSLTEINWEADIDAYTAALGPYLNADNPDLREFEKRGGKLIMLSGSADSCVPYHATLDYYEKTVEFFGSLERVQKFCLFYLVPGLDHGNGGPGVNRRPDILKPLIDWREKGIVPGELSAKRYENDKLVFDIPVYPYPLKSVYDAASRTWKAEAGPRGKVERVAERFLPASKE